jgi:hypothetical protein
VDRVHARTQAARKEADKKAGAIRDEAVQKFRELRKSKDGRDREEHAKEAAAHAVEKHASDLPIESKESLKAGIAEKLESGNGLLKQDVTDSAETTAKDSGGQIVDFINPLDPGKAAKYTPDMSFGEKNAEKSPFEKIYDEELGKSPEAHQKWIDGKVMWSAAQEGKFIDTGRLNRKVFEPKE